MKIITVTPAYRYARADTGTCQWGDSTSLHF